MKQQIKFIKQFWIAFIPIILLNIVALRQIYLHNTNYLSRWKGGGFGMFSKINERFVHIHLIHRNTFECAEFHYEISNDIQKIENYPDYLALEKLTRKLSKKIWVYSFMNKNFNRNMNLEKSVHMIGTKEKLKQDDKIAVFDSLEVQVYDIEFNKKNFSVRPKLIRKMNFLK